MSQPQPKQKDLLLFETWGLSMSPFLKSGEKIIVKKVKPQSLSIGDIIVYAAPENEPPDEKRPIAHRLIKKSKENGRYILFTRGDAKSRFAVEPVLEDRVIGRVEAIIRGTKVIRFDGAYRRRMNWLVSKFFVYLISVRRRLGRIKRFLFNLPRQVAAS